MSSTETTQPAANGTTVPTPVRNVWSPMEIVKAVLYLITSLAGLGIYFNTMGERPHEESNKVSVVTKEDLSKAIEESEDRIINALNARLKEFE